MDLQLLIAQWRGQLPPGFVRPAMLTADLPQCAQPRCPRKVTFKKNGELAKSCSRRVTREPSRRAARSSSLKSQLRSFTPPVSGHAAGAVNDGVLSTLPSSGRAFEPDPTVGNRRRSREDPGGVRRVSRTTGNGRRPVGRPPPDQRA